MQAGRRREVDDELVDVKLRIIQMGVELLYSNSSEQAAAKLKAEERSLVSHLHLNQSTPSSSKPH